MENILSINNNLANKTNEYLERFLKYLDVADITSKEYYAGIKRFFNYCEDNNISNMQRENIISFREYLKQENKSANTINLYLAGIKSFFKWLEYEGIYKDISKNIKSIPVSDIHKRQSLNLEQIKELLNFCQNDKERLIISLAVSTGMRCNEICNIRLTDFKMQNDNILLYVLGKARQGMKTDFVVIPEKLYNQILEYSEKHYIKDYLFISESNNNRGSIMSTRAMRNIVNKIYEKAGMKNEDLTFHSLRHSFSTISIKNGSDIREVSQVLRHKNISITMRYLHDIEAQDNKCTQLVSNLIF